MYSLTTDEIDLVMEQEGFIGPSSSDNMLTDLRKHEKVTIETSKKKLIVKAHGKRFIALTLREGLAKCWYVIHKRWHKVRNLHV